uniref:Methylmalonyl CoA epimerase n=1 Tax=Cyprinus carpio TaxID=7962 RepID=A0A8C2KIT8_CYPCA
MASSLLKVAVSLSFSFKRRLNHVAISARPGESHTRGVHCVCGTGKHQIRAFAPSGREKPYCRIPAEEQSWGMHHKWVDDINAAIVDLKEKKIRLLSPEPPIGAHGKPVMFLHPKDCGGVIVEIEQA